MKKQKNQYIYEYPRPAVTTDCVIFGFDEEELKVLLIERGIEPYLGKWALPGGFLDMDEDAESCARRILKKETGLEDIFMEQLCTLSAVDRDPRYRVISIAHFALVKRDDYNTVAGLDTATVQWFNLKDVPKLAFDHREILEIAIGRLEGKIKYQPVGFELLPDKFTLPDLHRLYEIILQESLDRRNFRKKMLSFNLLIDTGELQRGGQYRAPKLYQFDKEKYDELTQKGFYFEL